MSVQHRELAGGRWQAFTLAEQMGNIGSEISRAAAWQGRDEKLFHGAITRALELLDITIQDPRWRDRLKELTRTREIICDTSVGSTTYGVSLQELDNYFYPFAFLARRDR